MIRLTDVSKYYRSNQNVTLGLHKINLEFHPGEFAVITGESGSGKSTLLNVISGSDSYDEGEMYIEGQETSCYDKADWEQYRREKISFIYQNYNLIDSFTVLQNVKSAILIRIPQMDEKEADRKALEYIRKVGLEKQAKKKASHLSSGQKQRLSIARALAKETEIIVADEPTGNLDAQNSKEVVQLYVSAPDVAANKPEKELKAFAKTKELKPGEAVVVTLKVNADDLASYDEAASAWVVTPGNYKFLVGASSRDIKATLEAEVAAATQKTNNILKLQEPMSLLKR